MSDPPATFPAMLTDLDRRILAFAKRTYRHDGSRQQAILDEFGWTPTRYHQRLAELAKNPDALAAEPVLVNRLRRRLRWERDGSGNHADPVGSATV